MLKGIILSLFPSNFFIQTTTKQHEVNMAVITENAANGSMQQIKI